MTDALKPFINKALNSALSDEDANQAFEIIMSGDANDAQIAGLLMIMRTRGEALSEVTAAARIMRQKASPIQADEMAMDIVGTGGDGIGTLNISTATAIVVAGAGVQVAKHGNRNLSSLSGAADVLSASGVQTMISPEKTQNVLDGAGIAFMMAPMHHQAMKYVMPARQALGTRTLFNILGPLTNPASVQYQLTGAFSSEVLPMMANVLKSLGTKRAWLVHGEDGTDEISIVAPTIVQILDEGKITAHSLAPEDAGLKRAELSEIMGKDPEYNAQRFQALLNGENDAYRDAVLLNAAAALMIVKKAADLETGVNLAQHSIDSGAAKAKLAQMVKLSND